MRQAFFKFGESIAPHLAHGPQPKRVTQNATGAG
jgi:hypothetical protein